MMFIVSLIEFSKHVQNEISAKVMRKPQNFTADFADEMKLSKATVSRLAKQMIKAGKIIKKSRSLDV
jgi:DNA-binding MarR family transcriptional regulator